MFIGREEELDELKLLMKKRTSSLVVISGRKHIGKTRLIKEFSRYFSKAFFFEGRAPKEGKDTQSQKDDFISKMKAYKIPRKFGDDWSDIFWDLAQSCKRGKILVVLDEISWMGYKNLIFLGKLKIAWDQHFKNNDNLIMILSGSNSVQRQL